jgi:hypothetical protein
MVGELIGWWGCLSCGTTVANNHTGGCPVCGDRIGRIVPSGVPLDADIGIVMPMRDLAPEIEEPRTAWNQTALVAAAVLCIGSPLLGVSTVGWNGVAVGMALNIWSSSVGYYALARVWGGLPSPA